MKPLFIDLPSVLGAVGMSESTVQKLIRKDQFPKPRLMSDRRVGWLFREIEEWAEARPVANLPPPVNCQVGRGGATAS